MGEAVMLQAMLSSLENDVRQRADVENPYSKGYTDAIQYIREWVEEEFELDADAA